MFRFAVLGFVPSVNLVLAAFQSLTTCRDKDIIAGSEIATPDDSMSVSSQEVGTYRENDVIAERFFLTGEQPRGRSVCHTRYVHADDNLFGAHLK